MIRAILLLSVAAIAGCDNAESSGPPAPPAEHVPVEVAGLIVPGRLPELKESGFTDCQPDYYGYKCSKPFEYGKLKAKAAEVSLDGKPNMQVKDYYTGGPTGDVRQLKPEQLSYRLITLRFPDDRAFTAELVKDGWIRVDRRRATYYVKPGVGARWSVERHGIDLQPAAVSEVAAQLEEDRKNQAEQKQLNDNASAVLQQLK